MTELAKAIIWAAMYAQHSYGSDLMGYKRMTRTAFTRDWFRQHRITGMGFSLLTL